VNTKHYGGNTSLSSHGRAAIPPLQRFWCNRTAFKQNVVSFFGQRYLSSLDTWMREGSGNHPHRTLNFYQVRACDILLHHPIFSRQINAQERARVRWVDFLLLFEVFVFSSIDSYLNFGRQGFYSG